MYRIFLLTVFGVCLSSSMVVREDAARAARFVDLPEAELVLGAGYCQECLGQPGGLAGCPDSANCLVTCLQTQDPLTGFPVCLTQGLPGWKSSGCSSQVGGFYDCSWARNFYCDPSGNGGACGKRNSSGCDYTLGICHGTCTVNSWISACRGDCK